MKRNLFVSIVVVLALLLVSSIAGTAFAFKASDEAASMATAKAEKAFPPAGLRSVHIGNHGKKIAGDPEQAAIDSIDHLMKGAGSQAVKKSTKEDKLGSKHVRLIQHYKGLPVVGSEIIVHINKDNVIYLVQGEYLPSISVSTEPSISAAAALQIGLDELNGKPGLRVTQEPALVIYDSLLAYNYVLSHGGDEVGQWVYYVDAHTGNLIFRYNNIQRAAPTGNGAAADVTGTRLSGEDGSVVTISGWKETTGNYYLYSYSNVWGVFNLKKNDWEQNTTNNWGTTDPAVISLGKNFELTQTWVKNVLGRNSFNNAGALARGNAHEGTNYVNAYWDGSDFHFGDGDGATANPLTTLDIASHEYGHAITQYTSNLTYSYESGAMNESYSHITGAIVEFASQPDGRANYPSSTPGTADWLMGEDSWRSGALRDMRNPQRYQQPSYYKGTYWYTGSGDNGGVHYNSGVQNFAFYLLAEGGTGTNDGHSYSITGIGIPAAGEVAMRANTVYMRSSSQYADSRTAWVQAATDLGYSTTTVEDVWTAVGVGGSSCSANVTENLSPQATTVQPGGSLPVLVVATNNSACAVTFAVQSYVIHPDGNIFWSGQGTASLAANETRTHMHYVPIPTTAIEGPYTFGVILTDTKGNQMDKDSFGFTVSRL